jgi:luciferase family oxidoreductase group 1
MIKLSILDQSPIVAGSDAREALQQTIQIAITADRLGFTRLWVSEHHDSSGLAGSTPEVFISTLAAKTNQIRIGSGGVMLPHYSAYKVAENFRMLEALYPHRIDLGIGRAPGGMPRSTMALQEGRHRAEYTEQVEDLKGYLTDSLPQDHRFFGLTATPVIDSVPGFWLLGSSGGSAQIAAEKGTAFAFAHFINGDGGSEVVHEYKRMFRPSNLYAKPEALAAFFVICAETDAEAGRQAKSLDLRLLMFANGQRGGASPTVEMAESYSYTLYEQAFVRENRKRMIVGSPETVRLKMEALAKSYDVGEVMCVIHMDSFEKKLQALNLLATAFKLDRKE